MKEKNKKEERRKKQTRTRIIVLRFLSILILGAVVVKLRDRSASDQTTNKSITADSAFRSLASSGASGKPTAPTAPAVSGSTLALSHLRQMTQILSQFARPDSQAKDLIEQLQRSDEQPVVTRDANADTGEMVIVRTQKPLEGTRYFHAQYFSDEQGKGFVQHMSFEFQPGEHAMEDAASAVLSSFPELGTPQTSPNGFVRWNLNENYIVWIKRMTAEDLQDDPFNAYTSADVGTIRVAVELEIHEHEDEH